MFEQRYVAATPDSRIDHVGTYRRELPVSLTRMYENTLDWEHLPHLHGSSFSALECLDAGAWGWRARTLDHRGRPAVIELRLDRSLRRWVTRNIEGEQAGAEIWTHVFELAERRLHINVDFFVPGVAPTTRDKVGRAYAQAYDRLYDEDVLMMSGRQRELDRRVNAVRTDAALELPVPQQAVRVTFDGRDFIVCQVDAHWLAYPALCPHQLGPLSLPEAGVAQCPWHGYRFDLATGECLTGSTCRLGPAPRVTDLGATLQLRWAAD